MKLLILFSMMIAASVAVPNNYYQPTTPAPPPPPPPPMRQAYEAPKYEAPKYEAPRYEAPPSYDSYGKAPKVAEHIPIITHVFDTDHQGNYKLEIETANGIKGNAQGALRDIGAKEGPIVAKKGSYSYVGDDGKTYTTNWTADENGFHATGDHLPVAPPMPEAIRKSLEVPRIPEFQPENMNRQAGSPYQSYTPPSYMPAAPPAPLREAPMQRY